MPLVSVIVPVYNTSKYLFKCLDSIAKQTLKDIEVLVVNDGSTDNSATIINDFVRKDGRFFGFDKPNGGLSDARNFALDQAKGQYIAFIDSDDYIDANMLDVMVKKAEELNADMVWCDLVKVNEKGEEFRDLPQSPQFGEKIDLKKDFSVFGEMSCFACNKIFKKELFETKRFAKGLHFEDIELIPQLVLQAKVIAKIAQPFYKYFERSDSITKTHTAKGMDMFVAVDHVSTAFYESQYVLYTKELKRFQIFQGFYSYLAYVAYVKDENLRNKMLNQLKIQLKKQKISRTEILFYSRFQKNYLLTLPLKKIIFYLIVLFLPNLLNKIIK